MSETQCLTLIGTASIQGYVFLSNRLKENVGASYLVAQAVESWENHGTGRCEVIFIGGGNAALLFSGSNVNTALEIAKQAVYRWSKLTLTTAPGLRLVAAHNEVKPGGLREAFQRVREELRTVENRAASGLPLGSLPVCRQCNSTGLAAEEQDKDGNWISRESAAKQSAVTRANCRLRERYGDCLRSGFTEFPTKLEDLGMTAGQQHIAIVHADGNGIGTLFSQLPVDSKSDEQLKVYFQETSDKVKSIGTKALLEALRAVLTNIEQLNNRPGFGLTSLFPVRPVVEGGDDVTFVCHANLGLALAVTYLRQFRKQASEQNLFYTDGRAITAAAGVAIVPTKFPFARAYHLADQLCASAKYARAKIVDGSWLDFEIVRQGSSPSIGQSRLMNFVREGSGSRTTRNLLMRPYLVDRSDHPRSWTNFESLWRKLSEPELPRSKAKELHEALWEEREHETVGFLRSRGVDICDAELWQQVGDVERSPAFDALDALDFYVPLETP